MKWKIEEVGVHCNILFDNGERGVDSSPVAIGMPPPLAQRLVDLHNQDLNDFAKMIDLENKDGVIN